MVTANKINDAIKALARVTDAVSLWLLFAGGRMNALMPVAQFNPFEKLDKPIMQAGVEADAYKLWHQLSDERDRYLVGVDAELITEAMPCCRGSSPTTMCVLPIRRRTARICTFRRAPRSLTTGGWGQYWQ
jgi:hypothetical protein